jgi:hypothetical protein
MGYCLDVGKRYSDLGYWNNRVSSHQWVNNCTQGVIYRRSARAAAKRTTLTPATTRGIELPRH